MIRKNPDAAECVRILYGGSMKPSNAEEFLKMQDIDGGLIGGASLKASDYAALDCILLRSRDIWSNEKGMLK